MDEHVDDDGFVLIIDVDYPGQKSKQTTLNYYALFQKDVLIVIVIPVTIVVVVTILYVLGVII